MTVVFDGRVWTSYSQMYLCSGDVATPDHSAFKGQSNGLCGASVSGALFLITGIHTGEVPVQVTIVEAAPQLDDWEDIVEVSFQPAEPHAFLSGWTQDPVASFQLRAPSYRARWCASGMDAGKAQDVADETHPAPDRYALFLWPAAADSDVIVRRTSQNAAYWHDHGYTSLPWNE